MRKKLLLLFFVNIIDCSDTIFKLIAPYNISNNKIINTTLILGTRIALDSLNNTIFNKIYPKEYENKDFNIKKITSQALLTTLFSSVIVFPLLINVLSKKRVVELKLLAKYFCIQVALTILKDSIAYCVSQNNFVQKQQDYIDEYWKNYWKEKLDNWKEKLDNCWKQKLDKYDKYGEKCPVKIDDFITYFIRLLLSLALNEIHFNIFDYQLISKIDTNPIYTQYCFNIQNKLLNRILNRLLKAELWDMMLE